MIPLEIVRALSIDHDSVAQHGEGLCMPDLLRIYHEFILKKRFLDTEKIAYKLDTTTADGTHDGNFHSFLKELNIPSYEEVECSKRRLVKILAKLPPNTMAIANVFDMRPPRPGYTSETDGWEGHDLWFMNAISFNGNMYIQCFDPDTYWGGVRCIEINNLFTFWHDGIGARSGGVPKNGTFTGQENIRWFIILGLEKDRAYKLFDPPEYEIGYTNRNGLLVPSSGRLHISN